MVEPLRLSFRVLLYTAKLLGVKIKDCYSTNLYMRLLYQPWSVGQDLVDVVQIS